MSKPVPDPNNAAYILVLYRIQKPQTERGPCTHGNTAECALKKILRFRIVDQDLFKKKPQMLVQERGTNYRCGSVALSLELLQEAFPVLSLKLFSFSIVHP